jgi:hypothetical protein
MAPPRLLPRFVCPITPITPLPKWDANMNGFLRLAVLDVRVPDGAWRRALTGRSRLSMRLALAAMALRSGYLWAWQQTIGSGLCHRLL